MKKSLLLILLLILTLPSLALRKKKVIQMIENCKLHFNQNDAFAGCQFPTTMEVILSNGESLKSEKSMKIGFRDFEISVSGSGKRYPTLGRKLRVQTYYNAIKDPYIYLDFKLKKRPDFRWTTRIPIHFNGTYWLSFAGRSGNTGYSGKRGCHGYNGRDAYYRNGNGEDGRNGDHGFDGGRGNNGYNAANVNVFVSLVDFPRDNTKLVKIRSERSNGTGYTRYLAKSGWININARGGDAGRGGKGGRGGCGGSGGDGSFKRKPTSTDKGCSKEGYGGDGGRGGNGGRGGDGGNGGHGGDVHIYFAADAWFFQDHIRVDNRGGGRGQAGSGGNAGRGGSAGRGGRGSGRCGRSGSCGPRGQSGWNGQNGQVFFHNW